LPNTGWGWSLFGIEWGFAILGIVTEFLDFRIKKYLTQILYLGMGWLAIIALPVFLSFLSPMGLFLLVCGGVLYTVGFVFFVLDRFFPAKTTWFSWHDVFHFFVLAGSASHIWLAFAYLF
jgi:hemolysin III